jgi:hypothetical protein
MKTSMVNTLLPVCDGDFEFLHRSGRPIGFCWSNMASG